MQYDCLVIPNLIVPVFGRYDLLQRLLDTIDMKVSHLVLIDNGAGVTSLQFPDKVQNVHYIPLPANLGLAGSWNLGIKCLPHNDRWFFVSSDLILAPGDLEKMSKAQTNELTLSDAEPFFQLFCVGEEVLRHVGLFDESFFPTHHEDQDYLRRTRHNGFHVKHIEVGATYDMSVATRVTEATKNIADRVYSDNLEYHNAKIRSNDYSAGYWSLTRRRRNEWLR